MVLVQCVWHTRWYSAALCIYFVVLVVVLFFLVLFCFFFFRFFLALHGLLDPHRALYNLPQWSCFSTPRRVDSDRMNEVAWDMT